MLGMGTSETECLRCRLPSEILLCDFCKESLGLIGIMGLAEWLSEQGGKSLKTEGFDRDVIKRGKIKKQGGDRVGQS
jgi:hypothetical protein